MVKINEILSYKGENFKRVSLIKIKNLLKSGKKIEVNVIPCKANIYSMWIQFFTRECDDVKQFENFVNQVTFYNCNNELGNYLHYYIKC